MGRAIDVEEIVRAVLRELQSEPQPAQAEPAKQTLELTEKLVTLATLENRLTGIHRLTLRSGAVITPAALDELRARGIAVVRSSTVDKAPKVKTTLAFGVAEVADDRCDVAAMIEAIAKSGCAIERIAQTGLTSVTAELADHAAKNGRPALLLTARPAAAVCLANRHRGVRAVGGNEAKFLRDAIQDVAANFVAVDPAALSAFELRRLATEYCADWPRSAPKEIV